MPLIATIFRFVKDYKFSIILFLYLLLVAFYPVDFVFDTIVFLSIVSLMFLVNLLTKRQYFIPLNIIFILLIFGAALFSFLFKSYIYVESLMAILYTNTEEASAMFREFFIRGGIILVITIVLILLSQREMRKEKTNTFKISVLAVFLFSVYLPYQMNRMLVRVEYAPVTASAELNALYINSYAPVFYGTIVSGYATIKELYKRSDLLKKIEDRALLDGITLGDKATNYNKIVLVIGESSSSIHYSLYGYDVNTTPLLDELRDSDNSELNFYPAISPAPTTVPSIYRILSFSTIADVSRLYSNKVVVDLANDAGYNTYWITNQNMVGPAVSLFGFLKSGAKNNFYLRTGADKKSDLGLIPEFRKAFEKNEKQFIVLHLEGSHIHYADKYDDIDRTAINYESKDKKNLDYDRSIHHTDRFMKAVYDVMHRDSTAVMLYVSDHGEVPGLGHGYMKSFKEQYEIPFITYNFTKNNLDSLVNKYVDKENDRFNTVNISYVLSELLGYQISDALKNEAVEDSKYVFLPNSKPAEYNSIRNK